jgi:hypothetical protein
MGDFTTTRRDLIISSLLTALPMAFLAQQVEAAPDPSMTITTLPDEIVWTSALTNPAKSVENAPLWGKSSESGLYFGLTKWHPGYMSGPHWYETDRFCVVVSGTWWVASGEKFDPESTVPMPAGSFIRRVAKTPHYGGVKRDGKEPAVIAICGIGPITLHPVEATGAGVRKV